MTSGLRKAHKYIWLLLLIIVPVLMFFSIKNLNYSTPQNNTGTSFEFGNYNILMTDENNLLKAVAVKAEQAIKLDFEIKTPFKSASSEVYELNENKEKGKYLGIITSAKIYSFELNTNATGILIYDSLKKREITKLIF